MDTPSDRFSCYTSGEIRTGIGQLLRVDFPADVPKTVISNFFDINIRTVRLAMTKTASLAHGGYGKYTRYNIKQHEYGGGNGDDGSGGFMELLEIKNPPDGRCGIVIYNYRTWGESWFTEWNTLEDAERVWKKQKYDSQDPKELKRIGGFKRLVNCGRLDPWFYAIGDEQLLGDYTLPYGLEDDPVFRLGQKFVVLDGDDVPVIKTCMGTRFFHEKQERRMFSDSVDVRFRFVYWDDGSVWNEKENPNRIPRPIEENEAWIAEAINQFRQMLAGKNTNFTINFINGDKFVGKVVEDKKHRSSPEGRYYLIVKLEGSKKPIEGLVDFKPTRDINNITQFVTERFAKDGKKVTYIKVEKRVVEKGGKKWAGVFFLKKN